MRDVVILPCAALALLAMSGCAWTPTVHNYPSGLTIVRADQSTLDGICSRTSDDGRPIKHAAGCYDERNDTIWVLNSCVGAQALTHELGHREGVADPKKAGFSW